MSLITAETNTTELLSNPGKQTLSTLDFYSNKKELICLRNLLRQASLMDMHVNRIATDTEVQIDLSSSEHITSLLYIPLHLI